MAIHALRKGEWFFEVAAGMATRAIHSRVFSYQGIFGLGVIEVFPHRCQRNLLPPGRVVA